VKSFLGALAQRHRIIRYDCRGTGLSDRDTLDFSLEAQVRDLEAAADYYGLDRFAIYGSIGGGPASIAYAARHPERVSHLVLWGVIPDNAFWGENFAPFMNVMREQWDQFVDIFANLAFGWADSDTGERYASLTRNAITQQAMLRLVDQMQATDVTAEARAITVPTIVMVRREVKWGLLEESRALAGLIPGARLLILDGGAPAPFLGDVPPVVDAFLEFLATDPEAHVPSRPSAPPRVPLTGRETEVLRLLAAGKTSKQIAAELTISVSTAQRHIANIYAKVGARGRVEAAAYAFAQGLLRPHE
jgi:pimeloyl-ACP methyl ester carboxylesterase/DNA-binding CsgD family transcriptional regulator